MTTTMTLTPPKQGAAITRESGRLVVPDNPIIPFIEGDGTGADIWRASVRVLDASVAKAYGGQRKIRWVEGYAGQKSVDNLGPWLPDGTGKGLSHYPGRNKGPLSKPSGGGNPSLH